MQLDGCEILAQWREIGEWWNGEPYTEYIRYLDQQGIRREEKRDLGELCFPSTSGLPDETDHREEWSLRIKKKRDEKMALARLSYGAAVEPDHARVKACVDYPYVPLHLVSGYAFGRGTMLPEEIASFCAMVGAPAAALVDPHSLVGAWEFTKACRQAGIKALIGTTIELAEGGEIVLIARSKAGYESLSQLITSCHLDEPRLAPVGNWERVRRFSRGLLCLTGGDGSPVNNALARGDYRTAEATLDRLVDLFGSSGVFAEIERSYLPWERPVNRKLADLAQAKGVRCVAGGMITHARPDHVAVQDMLVCIDTLCQVDEVIGRKPQRNSRPVRPLNAERYLRTAREMSLLYADQPDWLANTLASAELCDDDIMPARTQLPPLYSHPHHALHEITWAGAALRYTSLPPRLKKRIGYELERIQRLGFSGHFLTMWDACRWAESQDILFSGRGSVVDSVVSYCLGFSRIDAYQHHLHFDRFLPEDGSKRPDIDIDFEAHRRNDVRGYLTQKYGEDRVATVAAVGAFCTRGIIREVGKAFGIPNEILGFLAKRIHGGVSADRLEAALESRPELRGSAIPKERFKWILALAERMMDIPRNIRSHSSGVVISSRPLCETVPVMWSGAENEGAYIRIIQWDKRSAKHCFDKFDILCLRGQDVLQGTQERIRLQNADFSVERVPLDDPETYAAMRSGELIGIPQSASPAMRQAHQRLRTQDLHDASLVQAGIRPGVGGAVKLNEMIARKRGKPFTFAHPDLEAILGITFGIVVFQEQIDQLLQKFGGYSSGEAEDLRDNIHKKRRETFAQEIKDEVRLRIMSQGYDVSTADEVIELVMGFKGYGFAQGHALAFAEISIRSIYCQQNFPAEYFASILDAQPAGYYGPCTLVNEARSRGVKILPVDINRSEQKFTVESVLARREPELWVPNAAIRVGFQQVAGVDEEVKTRIVEASELTIKEEPPAEEHNAAGGIALMVREMAGTSTRQRFRSFFDFVARIRPNRDDLERLILCGSFDSLHSNRRQLLWAIPSALEYSAMVNPVGGLPLEYPEPELNDTVDDFSREEKALYERLILDLDVDYHLMAFERERIAAKGGITTAEARRLPNRHKAIVVGNPIRMRFPPTPSGKRVVFFDLEDETGLLNVTCFDAVYQRDGHAIVCSPYVTIIGQAQHRDEHVAFLASRVFPYKPQLVKLPEKPNEFCCR